MGRKITRPKLHLKHGSEIAKRKYNMPGESNLISNNKEPNKIIFGIVGAIGTNFDLALKHIESIMLQFKHQTIPIKLSKLIKDENEEVLKEIMSIDLKDEKAEAFDKRCDTYMDGGNALRYLSDNNAFLALEAINKIKKESDKDENKNSNVVYVLDSFKHPEEIKRIRECYGPIFFLIGVHSSKKNRINILQNIKGIKKINDIERLIKRDEDENEDYLEKSKSGSLKKFLDSHKLFQENRPDCHKSFQKTRDAYKLADIYISVDGSDGYIKEQIERFVSLIFRAPHITPSKDEYGMYHAYSAALRSGDLSRQVGAAILTRCGDLISTGCNDVPQTGGGLYWPGNHDKRDLHYGYESNKRQLQVIIDDIAEEVKNCGVTEDENIEKIKETLSKRGKLKSITEYGRAVHAEMEAILSCCRNGIVTKDCVMYVTLFSCHNCTKHLICAGIKKVIYVEPYPKSYATILHGDDVLLKNPDECDVVDKVAFEPFIGISGRRYFDLFSMDWGSGLGIKRKDDSNGRIKTWIPSKAEFRFKTDPQNIEFNEIKAINELEAAKKEIKNFITIH